MSAKKLKTILKDINPDFLDAILISSFSKSAFKESKCIIIPTNEEGKRLCEEFDKIGSGLDMGGDWKSISRDVGVYLLDQCITSSFKGHMMHSINGETLDISQKKSIITIKSGPDYSFVAKGKLLDVKSRSGCSFVQLDSGSISSNSPNKEEVIAMGKDPYAEQAGIFKLIGPCIYQKCLDDSLATEDDCFAPSIVGLIMCDRSGRIKLTAKEKQNIANVIYPNRQLTLAIICNMLHFEIISTDNLRVWAGGPCYLNNAKEYENFFADFRKNAKLPYFPNGVSDIPDRLLAKKIDTIYSEKYTQMAMFDAMYTNCRDNSFDNVDDVIRSTVKSNNEKSIHTKYIAILKNTHKSIYRSHMTLINDGVRLSTIRQHHNPRIKMSNHLMTAITNYNMTKSNKKSDASDKKAAVGLNEPGPEELVAASDVVKDNHEKEAIQDVVS